jgi:hypothetical protein
MNRMSVEEYRELTGQKQSSKMRNVKTEVDGMIFDSAKEARHYSELKILKNQGVIIDFFRQVPFLLQEGYWKRNEWVKPIWYRADFLVVVNGLGSWPAAIARFAVHEVKGRWTQDAKNKRKMFEKRYPEYELVII